MPRFSSLVIVLLLAAAVSAVPATGQPGSAKQVENQRQSDSSFVAQSKLLTSLSGDFIQGGLAIGKTTPSAVVSFAQKNVKVDDEGYFLIGFHRDMPAEEVLSISDGDVSELHTISIRPRDYQIERVDGLPPSKVNPPSEETLKRIRAEGAAVSKARRFDSDMNYFRGKFIWPAQGRLSGFYGSQRILNGQPRRPHYGLDIAAPVGTPVIAPAAGVVRLTHDDMFYSGGTLVIDHGHGLSSTYIHLNSIEVAKGDTVEQGQLIATIGATGRVTGPHLDWRLNWFNFRLDPELLVPPLPEDASTTLDSVEEQK